MFSNATKSTRDGRKIAVVAGSGLGDVGQDFRVETTVAFEDIEGVGACSVEGHKGEVRFCAVGEKECALVLGRRHVYEGGRLGMDRLVGWLAGQNITDLVVVSAAGALTRMFEPGELVAVRGIIDLQNRRRLRLGSGREPELGEGTRSGVAAAVPERGLREYGTSLSSRLTSAVESAAGEVSVAMGRGTLACCQGPAYESSAEVRALRSLGADLATMSSAPEVLFAGRFGLDVAVVGAVTNHATGIGPERLDHAHVLKTGQGMSSKLSRLLAQLVRTW